MKPVRPRAARLLGEGTRIIPKEQQTEDKSAPVGSATGEGTRIVPKERQTEDKSSSVGSAMGEGTQDWKVRNGRIDHIHGVRRKKSCSMGRSGQTDKTEIPERSAMHLLGDVLNKAKIKQSGRFAVLAGLCMLLSLALSAAGLCGFCGGMLKVQAQADRMRTEDSAAPAEEEQSGESDSVEQGKSDGGAAEEQAGTAARAVLTEQQAALVKRLGTIRIGYERDEYPITRQRARGDGSTTSGNSAEPEGIAIDLARTAAKELGLQVRFVPIPDGRSGLQLLRGGAVDVYITYTDNAGWGTEEGIVRSDVFLSDPLVAVTRRNAGRDGMAEDGSKAVAARSKTTDTSADIPVAAVILGRPGDARTADGFLENFAFDYCKDTDACLAAVRSGEADIWFADQYVANYHLQSPFNEGLEEQFGYGRTRDYCFMALWRSHSVIEVLNAAIRSLNQEEIQTVVGVHTRGGSYQLTTAEKMYGSRRAILWTSVTTAVVLFLLIRGILVQRRYSREMARKNRELEKANRAREDFLSSMSHDMRTPLNGIRGALDLLEQEKHDPLTEELLSMSRVSADHLLTLIDDILDMAKLRSGRFALRMAYRDTADFALKLLAVMMPIASKNQITMHTHTECESCPEVEIDPERLMQVCINLLSNAVKYTPAGGLVGFTFRAVPEPEPYRGKIQIVVEDNGIGMSEDFLKKATEPFTRAEGPDRQQNGAGGSGLGLAITAELVRLMEGQMRIESQPGKGTRISISVPVRWRDRQEEYGAQPDSASREEAAADAKCTAGRDGKAAAGRDSKAAENRNGKAVESREGIITGGRDRNIGVGSGVAQAAGGADDAAQDRKGDARCTARRVLLVEDNAINREIARLQLENFHVEADVVRTGEEAVDRFLQSPEGYYDVVLMDVMLPGISGPEAARQIRLSGRSDAHLIRIAAMSADPYRVGETTGPGADFDAFVPKPFSTDDLAGVLFR